LRKLALGFCLVAGVSTLSASIIVTAEAPGVQATTVSGTITESFNSLPVGALGVYVSPVGTYQTGAQIVPPDAFGGANQTDYISVGAQSGTTSYILDFNGLQSYFGLYWAAGDIRNRLEFFNGGTMVGNFTVADVLVAIAGPNFANYFGNPNTGQDGREPFVYLDFTSNALGTNFDSLRFLNNSTTGFETDNHSVVAGVPEPSTYALMLTGLGLIVVAIRRRKIC
jgi:hypothetical protein